MFTGEIKNTGTIKNIRNYNNINQLSIEINQSQNWKINNGDSLAIDGVCLTVTDTNQREIQVEVMPETINRTTLKQITIGQQVNLEPALLPTERLAGHFVLGHVDTTGVVSNIVHEQETVNLTITFNSKYFPYIVEKGSITINGVSLTVTNIQRTNFTVKLIPYTLKHTNLGSLTNQESVNLETDIIGKYLVHLQEDVINEK